MRLAGLTDGVCINVPAGFGECLGECGAPANGSVGTFPPTHKPHAHKRLYLNLCEYLVLGSLRVALDLESTTGNWYVDYWYSSGSA